MAQLVHEEGAVNAPLHQSQRDPVGLGHDVRGASDAPQCDARDADYAPLTIDRGADPAHPYVSGDAADAPSGAQQVHGEGAANARGGRSSRAHEGAANAPEYSQMNTSSLSSPSGVQGEERESVGFGNAEAGASTGQAVQ